MNDHRNLPVPDDDGALVLDDCSLRAHALCNASDCEVHRTAAVMAEISAGQVRVAIVTAICGLLVAAAFGLTLLAVWAWHAFHGNAMPAVPWFIISIAMVPFGSSVITICIPKKAPWQIGGPNVRTDS